MQGFFRHDGSPLLQGLLQACYQSEAELEQVDDFDQYHWQLSAPSSWYMASAVGTLCQSCLEPPEATQIALGELVQRVYSRNPQVQLASYVALKHALTDPSFLEFGLEEEEMQEQEVRLVTESWVRLDD